MKTLENICRDFLNIGRNIPIRKILKFARDNEDEDLESFFLINFRSMSAKKLTSFDVFIYRKHFVLGYSPLEGTYGKYYILYCEIQGGNGYMKLYSNKKINDHIWESERVFGRKLINELHDVYKCEGFYYFYPCNLKEYKNITYREIKWM